MRPCCKKGGVQLGWMVGGHKVWEGFRRDFKGGEGGGYTYDIGAFGSFVATSMGTKWAEFDDDAPDIPLRSTGMPASRAQNVCVEVFAHFDVN